ncbi:MAG: hypothetical protein M1828_006055 [Chrysothrix sp. TS-e1954]|nr:MAG: hypothetical protein M1828_006055 [Chrysothrix sp. TS-e1954]
MEAPQNDPHPAFRDPREIPAQRSGSLRHPPLATLVESEEGDEPILYPHSYTKASQAGQRSAETPETGLAVSFATAQDSATDQNPLYEHLRRFSFESLNDITLDGQSLEKPVNVNDRLDIVEPSPKTNLESHSDQQQDPTHQPTKYDIHDTTLPHLPPTQPTAASKSVSDTQNNASFDAARNSVSESEYEYEYHDTLDIPQQDSTMPVAKNKAPDLQLQVDAAKRFLPKRADSLRGKKAMTSQHNAPQSPTAKVSNFFGWSSKPNNMESPATVFDESQSESPDHSPQSLAPEEHASAGSSGSPYDGYDDYFSDDQQSRHSASPRASFGRDGTITRDGELLNELREVSTELALSIKREMDLEDEVDKARADMPTTSGEHTRRTSDYYSDSGASSSRFPIPDAEFKIQNLEQMRRKAEQEKAQMRIDMVQKVQDNLNHTKGLELHIQSLEEELHTREFRASDTSEKEKELEMSIGKLKRRLSEESQDKRNFEVLYEGMKEEIQARCNERDNLRDEVVPQLRARLEGLESQAAETQNLVYETTRMQQEIQSLKNENQTLVNARRLQLEMQNQSNAARFKSISEAENDSSVPRSGSLSRTNSMARSKSVRQRSSSIYGPGSPKDIITPETLPERIKDVEDQRDALHRTLRAIIVRQDHMTRKHVKQIHILETERDKALDGTPRRAAFNIEVQNLRGEVNTLRHRADEAMEQKWQCEKGLGGLKMDLDRAQQETGSLRELLREHDITVPLRRPSAGSNDHSDDVYAESLDQAYEQLKGMHAQSLARVQAGSERPASLDEAEARMLTLAHQVQDQLTSNEELRARLTQAVDRGEKEQEASTRKINDLQVALRAAEERVMAAQSVSEESINKQEEHVRQVKEAVGEQSLRGLKSPVIGAAPTHRRGIGSRTRQSANSIQELRTSVFAGDKAKTPRLDNTTSGKGMSVQEISRTQSLEGKVAELEAAAVQADNEMQGVVERMNKAQIEVAELQTQRDEAMKQTRKLQRDILEERERVKAWGL